MVVIMPVKPGLESNGKAHNRCNAISQVSAKYASSFFINGPNAKKDLLTITNTEKVSMSL